MKSWKRILRGQRGQDLVEYALLAAFIATTVMYALVMLGPPVRRTYDKLHDAFVESQGGPTGGKGAGTPTDQ